VGVPSTAVRPVWCRALRARAHGGGCQVTGITVILRLTVI
jgi:hypothetical protein